MEPSDGRGPPPPPPPYEYARAFQAMVASLVKSVKNQPTQFVKKLVEMPKIALPPTSARRKAIALADRGLIDQFTWIWPSPRMVAIWIEKNWRPLIKGSISHYFCGRGFFTFLFENKEDKDLIFRTEPYFLGARGMYLNKWTPDFSSENDVLSAVQVWVCLPDLPLHCWNDDAFGCIGNSIGCYIDRVEPKENIFSLQEFVLRLTWKKESPKQ